MNPIKIIFFWIERHFFLSTYNSENFRNGLLRIEIKTFTRKCFKLYVDNDKWYFGRFVGYYCKLENFFTPIPKWKMYYILLASFKVRMSVKCEVNNDLAANCDTFI